MATIVEYTKQKPPENAYPIRIVSPPAAKACCANGNVERVGKVESDEGRTYYYLRCRTCGYTVRHFPVPVLPDRLNEGIDLRALTEIFAEK